jgi:hypothetical protein
VYVVVYRALLGNDSFRECVAVRQLTRQKKS